MIPIIAIILASIGYIIYFLYKKIVKNEKVYVNIFSVIGLTLIASLFFTLLGSMVVCCHHNRTITEEKYYELTSIADGVYGYHKDRGIDVVYYIDENDDIRPLKYYTDRTEIIYSNNNKPYYSFTSYDIKDETLRYLFWNFYSDKVCVCVPFGSITEEPD